MLTIGQIPLIEDKMNAGVVVLLALTKESLFQDPHIGKILAGYVKTLLFVEVAIRTSLASQPILTMYDLEMIMLTHPVFAGKKRFEDACIGKLQFHPLVKEGFGLKNLEKIPDDFPAISSSELVRKLFATQIRAQIGGGKRLSDLRSRSVKASLQKLASQYGFNQWTELGRQQPNLLVGCWGTC